MTVALKVRQNLPEFGYQMLSAWVPAVHRSHWGYWLPGTQGLMETKETECTQLLLLLGEGRPWLLVAKLPEETLGTFSGQYCLLSTLGFLGCQAVKRVISRGKEDVKECLRLQ